jgi:16S rRNA (uracil1498-N3)-methyltransferase
VTRRRWIADEWSGETAAITGQNARHLAQVLRAKVGQTFELASGGELRLGTISHINDDRVTFALGVHVEAARVQREITLALAVFKFDRLEWAIEKTTELGVACIVPVIAQRTDAHLAKAAAKRVDRWRRVAHEASQQSRRLAEPEIAEPISLKQFLAAHPSGTPIVLSENESGFSLSELIDSAAVTLAIGPEGGWTEAEEQAFRKTGWEPATLGPTILRAETAAIAAVSLASLLP